MPHVPSGFSRQRTRELLHESAEQLQSRTDKQMNKVKSMTDNMKPEETETEQNTENKELLRLTTGLSA